MADQTITFDTQSGTPYGANLTINGGSNFNNTFRLKILMELHLIFPLIMLSELQPLQDGQVLLK